MKTTKTNKRLERGKTQKGGRRTKKERRGKMDQITNVESRKGETRKSEDVKTKESQYWNDVRKNGEIERKNEGNWMKC